MCRSERALPEEAKEEVDQFEQAVARRLRRLAEAAAPRHLERRGLDLIRSQRQQPSADAQDPRRESRAP
jgi:hypothetical protein